MIKEKSANENDSTFKAYSKAADLNNDLEEYLVYVESLIKEEKLGNKNTLAI